MENFSYKNRCEQPISWIEECLYDIKRHRDENNPNWVRKMAIRLADYAITLAEYADDWQFEQTYLIKKEEA